MYAGLLQMMSSCMSIDCSFCHSQVCHSQAQAEDEEEELEDGEIPVDGTQVHKLCLTLLLWA